MSLQSELAQLIAGLLYTVALLGASSAAAPDPTGVLSLITLLPGAALLVHASRRDNLRELGYATCGLIAISLAVVAAKVVLGVAGVEIDATAELALAAGLAASLIVLYAHFVRHPREIGLRLA